MSDEGFHEIQLNGKQLVFLFMAATVVAVVIFLCGVMVGRGVPTRTAAPTNSPEHAALDPTASVGVSAAHTGATTDNAPLTAQETLTYPSLLEDPDPPVETLAPFDPAQDAPSASRRTVEATPAPVERTAAAPTPKPVAPRPLAAAPKPVAPAPKPAVPPPAPREAVANDSLAEPPGNGFVVQVAAVRQRAEANTIARRLSGKGYPAFVTTSGANFRVRVGKFTERREAESVAGRLAREEQFKPWITR
jgi:DedD protein